MVTVPMGEDTQEAQ
jgi:hypothetical protein